MRLLPATMLFAVALPACKPSPAFLAHGCLAITDRATCMVSPEASAPVESRGSIDAAYAGQYTCNVLVVSAIPSGKKQKGRPWGGQRKMGAREARSA